MANVILVIQDDRVRKQCEQFLGQLGMEDLRVAAFDKNQEFTEIYFRERKSKDEPAKESPKKEESEPDKPAETELRLFSEVNILIFALDSIGEKSNTWLDKVRVNFKKYKYWPAANSLRVVMLKYEDDGLTKLDVLHPILDDLIYLPLDRLVFLQKLEILLKLPKVTKPSYLFNQEIKAEIEISKLSKVDRLSDVGLAIRNPMPLKKGLPGHFYLQLPGEKLVLELRGKVLRSEPHPEVPGQFLVYFTYFGLSKSDLSAIRRSLSKSPRYTSLYNDDRSVFLLKENDLFASAEDKRLIGLAVIDPDAGAGAALATQLMKDMDRIKVISESSYSLFLHRYLDHKEGDIKGPPRATEPSDIYAAKVSLSVKISDMTCLSVDPIPVMGDLILGHVAETIFKTPEAWLNLITDKPSKLVLEESVRFAERGRTSDKVLIFQDGSDVRRALNCVIKPGAAEHLVDIELSTASLSDIAVKLGADQAQKEIEALILDAAYVPDDPVAWMQGLRNRAAEVGLVKTPFALKFFLMAESLASVSNAWLDLPDILGLMIKPLDNRQLLFLLSEYLPNKNTVYNFENLGWAQPGIMMHISKNVQLEALSEYGAKLRSKQQLAPGTMVYLRRSIYVNAPNQCLAARVYACEPHASEKGFFQVYTTYFGINDQFLKFARTWIRENYAAQKSKEA